jgi:hypothetical protein
VRVPAETPHYRLIDFTLVAAPDAKDDVVAIARRNDEVERLTNELAMPNSAATPRTWRAVACWRRSAMSFEHR